MAVFRRRIGRLAPSGRSVSGGRRQPSFLPREEGVAHAGEEGRRSRCGPEAGSAPDPPSREAVWGLPRAVTRRTTRIGPPPASQAHRRDRLNSSPRSTDRPELTMSRRTPRFRHMRVRSWWSGSRASPGAPPTVVSLDAQPSPSWRWVRQQRRDQRVRRLEPTAPQFQRHDRLDRLAEYGIGLATSSGGWKRRDSA